jgi:hypothetical protein
MALIVEDGTGKADAESYLSVADATAYHTKMGNKEAWAAVGNEAAKEAMLRQGADYLRDRYFGRWMGVTTTLTQRLDWPRIGTYYRTRQFVASDVVPEEIKNACAELALRAASAALNPDTTQTIKREKIGPIEVEYDEFSPTATSYAAIDAMLAPYLLIGATSGINMPRMRT